MRRPKKTVTINLADYLSAGTYNVKVKSKGTDIRDSADSNSVECVVAASGYSVSVSGNWDGGDFANTYLKVNIPPTSQYDADAWQETYPYTIQFKSGVSSPIAGVETLYIWTTRNLYGKIKINNGEWITITQTYDNPYTITLSSDISIILFGSTD